MKNLNCKNCGAPMVLDASAMTAVCPYCRSRYVLNREDTDYFRNFFLQMNRFLSVGTDAQERRLRADALWESAESAVFSCTDGSDKEIRYLHRYTLEDADVYVARRNILFHFRRDGSVLADRFRRTVSFLDYPSADTRNLSDFFPKVSGGFALADGTTLLAVSKDDDEYPLRLFGQLSGRHVAWIISRMENLACVLEYNGLVHPEINADSLFINPYTHQASLYGSWWKVGRQNSYAIDGRSILRSDMNLQGIRNTAAGLLGFASPRDVKKSDRIPAALAEFIRSRPSPDAYEDFAYWDRMLLAAYGERKFVTMDTDDGEIYGRKE